jgi:hypothetical protein
MLSRSDIAIAFANEIPSFATRNIQAIFKPVCDFASGRSLDFQASPARPESGGWVGFNIGGGNEHPFFGSIFEQVQKKSFCLGRATIQFINVDYLKALLEVMHIRLPFGNSLLSDATPGEFLDKIELSSQCPAEHMGDARFSAAGRTVKNDSARAFARAAQFSGDPQQVPGQVSRLPDQMGGFCR